MKDKVLALIQRYDMFKKGDNVIVALSGGGDSVALFHLLHTLSPRLGVQLLCAHFEHGLRGEESLRDAAHVRALCAEYSVPLIEGQGNMGGKTPPAGQSVEEWARKLRYAFFEQAAAQHGAVVATAHNQNDNAETVLFHAARGAGTRGLAGIRPVRGIYRRPLLDVSRAEVEQYLEQNRLVYMTDSTNLTTNYARNRLRLQVLPQLEQVHPGAAASLAGLAEDMRTLDTWLEQCAEDALQKALCAAQTDGDENSVEWGQLLVQAAEAQNLPPKAQPMQKEPVPKWHAGNLVLCGRLLCALPPPVRQKCAALLCGRSAVRAQILGGASVLAGLQPAQQLRSGRSMWREGGWILVGEYSPDNEQKGGWQLPFAPGKYTLPGGYKLTAWVEELTPANRKKAVNSQKTAKKGLTFVADYDKISECSLRTRLAKDSFSPKGRGVTKTLKKWMNEEGVPPSLRGTLPLLAQGSRVLWVWGEDFCEGTGITSDTRRVLWIQIQS